MPTSSDCSSACSDSIAAHLTPTAAATLIQSRYRAHLATHRLSRLHKSATTIQRHVRGHLTRTRLKALLPALRLTRTLTQRLRTTRERIALGEQQAAQVRNLHAGRVKEWEEARTVAGAVIVQRWWRGVRARRMVRRLMADRTRERGKSVDEAGPTNLRSGIDNTTTAEQLPEPDVSLVASAYNSILTRIAKNRANADSARPDLQAVLDRLREAQTLLNDVYMEDREGTANTGDIATTCRVLRTNCDAYIAYLNAAPSVLAEEAQLPPVPPLPHSRVSKVRSEHILSLKAAKRRWWEAMTFTDADDKTWDFSAEPEAGRMYC
ncbi:hypothetical protein HK104_008123 [Borealophlyctis nickersoniae]|nr:hypothetical protein HK104_008123 [Borealophlyctis nickersoniae]